MFQTGDRVNNALYVRAILKQKKTTGLQSNPKMDTQGKESLQR